MSAFRIGIDLGRTKIEIAALDQRGKELLRRRVATPRTYDAIIAKIADLVVAGEQELGGSGSVGVGIPGVISPATDLVKNASTVVLNGHKLDRDLAAALGREVRVQNDANCFALSEAVDGAGAGARVVFGVIIGSGSGSGIVVDGKLLEGRHRIGGEWGHNPLPWPKPEEVPGPRCWCGKHGCIETFLSGPGLAADCDGPGAVDARGLPARAAAGDKRAAATLERYADRLARALAHVANIIDPDVIVLGGGLSNLDYLYADVLPLMGRYVFSDVFTTPILHNVHGDSSGVRGAAWLWP
jgi:fructokinase